MAKRALSNWSLYSLSGIFILAIGVFGTYAYIHHTNYQDLVASGTAALKNSEPPARFDPYRRYTSEDDWQTIYPNTKPMLLAGVPVQASIAKTWPERIAGLSNTPYLPEDVVKLFVFDSPGLHSFWMKDMNYAIDIIWLNEQGRVVHIAPGVAPDTFPELFVPNELAVYVIETVAGFVETNSLRVGQFVDLPNLN